MISLISFIIIFAIFFGIGMFWYSPKGFANAWVKENKIDPSSITKQNASKAFSMAIAFRFMQTIALLCLIYALKDINTIYAVLIVLAVSSIPMFDNFIWKVRTLKAVVIDFSYFSVSILLSFIIVGFLV